ncbi:MAG TPA: VCBS repeat-containing protein, partial [Planctomycetota bacterium]|nr:VCBS repeat-containing protein [Planctomycetota bacterium]
MRTVRKAVAGNALVLAAALGTTTPATAQRIPEPIDAALRARFGFLGPLVEKVGDGATLLLVAPIAAGDARARAVLCNAHRARVEAWKVEGEQASRTDWPIDAALAGLALADVDGDGRAEVLSVDEAGRLRVQVQGGGVVRDPIEVGKPALAGCLRTADIDGDGRPDAVVLTADGVRTVTGLDGGDVRVNDAMPLGAARPTAFHLDDVDRDGRADVIVTVRSDRMALRVQLGTGDAVRPFSAWLVFDPSELAAAFPGSGVDGATLASIEGPHRRIVEYAFAREAADLPAAQLASLAGTAPASGRAFAHGDVDGDGDPDLVVAQPDRAQLTFLLEVGSRFTQVSAPTLAGVTSVCLTDVDGDGKVDLVLASPDEDALAWKSGAQPLTAFPQRLPATDKPVAVAADGDDLLFLARNERRDAALHRLRRGAAQPVKVADLGRLTADPGRLLIGQFDGRHGRDVAFVVPGVGLRVLFAQEDGTLRGDDAAPGFTRKLDEGALTIVTHDGGDALVVVRDSFLRTFRFDAAGQPVILRQDNGPPGAETLGLLAEGPGGARIVLDRKSQRVYRQQGEGAAVARPLPARGVTHLLAHGDDALCLGG